MIAQPLPQAVNDCRAVERQRPAAQAAILSDRFRSSSPWTKRNITVSRLGASCSAAKLLSSVPDIVVLDLACSGTEFATDAGRLHDLVQAPVVVVAEGASGDAVVSLLRHGAEDVVTEVASDDLLAARVAAVLRRRFGPCADRLPSRIQFSGAEVDLSRRLVSRQDRSQTLSRTEYRLLHCLLDAGGRACSPAELITRVWGAECASAGHYLRLYIRYLRQKVEAIPEHPCNIINVRGVGYRLAIDLPESDPLIELPRSARAPRRGTALA